MKPLFLTGLRGRLLLLVFLAALPALALILYSASEQHRSVAADMQQDALRLARLASSEQQQLLEATRQLLAVLARLPEIRNRSRNRCSELLADLLKEYPRYSNLGVASPDGNIFCSGRPHPAAVNIADRRYFRGALESRAFSAGEYQIGRITGEASVNFGSPVLDESGRIAAVAYAAVDLTWLNRLAADAGLPAGTALTILDGNGMILARHPDPEGWIGKSWPDARALRSILERREGVIEAANLDAAPSLFGFTPLPGLPRAQPLYVMIGIPKHLAFASVDRMLARNLMALGLVSLLMFISAWFASDLFVLRRVRALVKAAKRLGSGDLGARTGLPHDGDELLQLARAFDEMAGNLQKRETEAKQAEEALRKSEEQLRHAQKMEAVGRLAGGVAHDFNNLLTAIIGYSDLLRSRLDEDDPSRSQIEEIHKAGQRAASLTSRLLVFSRRKVLEPKVLDLNEIVAGTEKLLRRLIGEDISLVTMLEPDLGRVKTDPGQMEQVIMNLAVNARDAMPEGGKLTLETANVELDDSYAREHTSARPGPYAMLAVSDTGCGMDAETQARIFEPFFTTKGEGKGTGLGLSIVYGIVKQSKGHIWVYSQPGRGTTFKVYLPLVHEAAETVETAEAHTVCPRGSETILLAEDEEVVRRLAREALESSGYAVLEARHGEQALQQLVGHDGPIHLLLTDVIMPRLGGAELAERAKSLRPELKVIYMSGHAGAAIAHQGVLDIDAPFLQKPFTPNSLLRKVREVLDARDEGRAGSPSEHSGGVPAPST